MEVNGEARRIGIACVVGRSPDIALVVDDAFRVVAANEEAERALRAQTLVTFCAGRFSTQDKLIMSWLKTMCAEFSLGEPVSAMSRTSRWESGVVQINLSRLADGDASAFRNHNPQHILMLIVIKELTAPPPPIDTRVLLDLFQLTEAETAICALLRKGLTISEIASQRNISRETVRHQLKMIFRKCGTGRQGELVALLQRLR